MTTKENLFLIMGATGNRSMKGNERADPIPRGRPRTTNGGGPWQVA
jgi:hypothetical protein